MEFTKKQAERYSRQLILKNIGVSGQKKNLPGENPRQCSRRTSGGRDAQAENRLHKNRRGVHAIV